MTHVVQAGAEELIWIVVGLFWVIAQIAGAAAKKKTAPPRPVTDEEGEPAEDPFAELMRKLSGVQEIKIPQPPEPQWVEETPAPVRKSEMHLPPTRQPRNELRSATREPVVMPAAAAEVDVRPKMSAFRNALPAMKHPSMNLRINKPSYAEASAGKQGLGSELQLQDKKSLRRAMLSHIIFSPPKALQR